jgi:hypothetical protein
MDYPHAKYKTGEPVMLGDHVEFRTWPELWLVKHRGRVVYIPGVSPPDPNLDGETLKWACIEFGGSKLGPLVHPETGVLRGVALLKRSDDELRSTPEDFDFPESGLENEKAEPFSIGPHPRPESPSPPHSPP